MSSPRWRPLLFGVGAASVAVLAVLGLRAIARPTPGLSDPETPAAVLRGVLERDGLGPALDALTAAAAVDSAVLRDAHQLAHDLGRRAVAARGDASVISECRPDFSSGCYHGVVESFVKSRGQVDMQELERMCLATRAGDRRGPVSECVHGLGHGVLGALSLDLGRTLQYCDALSEQPLRGGCHSGAFMEAIITAQAGSESMASGAEHAHGAHAGPAHDAGRLTIDPTDAFSPCNRFDDPYATACWTYQGYLLLRRHEFDAGAALATCGRAPAHRGEQCYQSIGFQITGLFQRGDAWLIEQCGRQGPGPGAECAAGAAAALSSMDWSGTRAGHFCAVSPPGWKAVCYRSAARVLGTLASPVELARFCAEARTYYADACRSQTGSLRRTRNRRSRGSRTGRSTIRSAGR